MTVQDLNRARFQGSIQPCNLEAAVLVALLAVVSTSASSAQAGSEAGAKRGQTAAAEAAPLVEERDPEAWPRVLEGNGFRVEVYPPQYDDWDGRYLKAHAALAIGEKDKESSTYGVVKFIARTRVDKEARLVVFDEYQSIAAEIPSAADLEAKLLGFLQK